MIVVLGGWRARAQGTLGGASAHGAAYTGSAEEVLSLWFYQNKNPLDPLLVFLS